MISSWLHFRPPLVSATLIEARRSFWRWARNLGGPGLIAAGIVDNSVIPTPGITDALTIVLSAREKNLWLYYAFMATVGAIVGGYLTYRMARQGGKATFEKYVSREKVAKIEERFAKWGFGAVAIGAVLPPPAPMTPFLLAAGTAQYSRKKFIGALALGRSVRFTILAFLGARYGGEILGWFSRYARVILFTFIGLSVAGAVFVYVRWRHSKSTHTRHPQSKVA